ncbi:UNVERIFIED_CONTAM: hypothetical protein Slati_1105600 [Sesamum latifolium]|uniref:Uncharacterized protein n=1 Tax=Sesamum latifolium TaxID=2727402 RepID=A0AAW2XHC0_9LAMI
MNKNQVPLENGGFLFSTTATVPTKIKDGTVIPIQPVWTNSRGSSYGSLGGLVGMTRVPGSDSMGVVLGLEESWQSRAHDSCILGLCER